MKSDTNTERANSAMPQVRKRGGHIARMPGFCFGILHRGDAVCVRIAHRSLPQPVLTTSPALGPRNALLFWAFMKEFAGPGSLALGDAAMPRLPWMVTVVSPGIQALPTDDTLRVGRFEIVLGLGLLRRRQERN
jgi:hypothetical protein